MCLNELAKIIHDNATEKGFYDNIQLTLSNCCGSERKNHLNTFICQQLILIVSEVCEAVDALRKEDSPNFREEIADTVIRLFDLSAFLNIDIDEEITDKMEKNKTRGRLHNKLF